MLADEQFLASAVVAPGSTEEVQEVVRIANRHGIPLSPISTGKNNGYGGPSPRLTGAIVVDMGKRMNRILEVNEKYGYALLEPGVTYFDLYEHLQEQRTSSSCSTRPTSVGGAWWATRWTEASATRPTATTSSGRRAWRSSSRRARSCAPVWARCPARTRGSCSLTASARTRTGCSPSPTWASSRRWASRSCSVHSSMTYLITFQEESDLEQIVDVMLPLRINMAPIQNYPVLRNIILDAGVVSKRSE